MLELGAQDVLDALLHSQQALVPYASADWTQQAGSLDWDCRHTLDHMADSSASYAGRIAVRAPSPIPSMRNGNPAQSIEDLLQVVNATCHVVARLVEALPSNARVFHPAGMADASGYAAMTCTEQLLHTFDITRGLGVPFSPPSELCARVLARLFPWIGVDEDPWVSLCWAAGRISIPGRSDTEPDWWWQCAPLNEWSGAVKKRPLSPS